MLGNITAGGEVIGNLAGGGRRYFLKDHVGSVRTTVDRNGNIVGYDDYCPFGLAMPGRSSNTANPNDDYKFTGYEKDDEAGLDLYHAGARIYDPVLGRFMSIDRFYDKYPHMSTYQYAANNPINFIDINGDSVIVAGTKDEILDMLFGISIACECKVSVGGTSENEDGSYSTTITNTDIDDSSENWENLTFHQQIISASVGSTVDMKFMFTNNSEVARWGGANTSIDDGNIILKFAKGFHDGNWEGMRYDKAPSYQFINTNVPAPNQRFAWWVTGGSETYSATGYTKYRFHEVVAHEIIHINDFIQRYNEKFKRSALETNAIKATNKLRKKWGLPSRSH